MRDAEDLKIINRIWSDDLSEKMKNRLVMSHHKYGDLKNNFLSGDVELDYIKNAEYRIGLYLKSGNKEHIVDAMNFLLFEYSLMNGEFKATDNTSEARYV